MRLIFILLICFAVSCKQKSKQEKTVETPKDTVVTREKPAEAPVRSNDVAPANPTTAEENAVNSSLQKKYGSKWQALNDKHAKWMKDAYDYFIVPKRKKDPNYPYIAIGDFNGDGRQDTAALITDSTKNAHQIAILSGDKNIVMWEEDILDDAAINTLSKPGEIEGMVGQDLEKTKIVKIKGDAIEVTYFEKASFVIYWDKKQFRRIQTSD